MYRPNFCAECGEKLLRLHWHFWTSRRFCNGCARRLRRARFLPLLLASLSLLAGGYVIGRVRPPAPPPLLIVRRSDSPVNDGQPPTATKNSQGAIQSSPPTTTEAVFICGARTKKGTPCSRRVHGPVRCWQHQGMSSIIPVVPIK
jgi:hypothetical protein